MTTKNSIQAEILHDTLLAKRLLVATGVLTVATFFIGVKTAQQGDPKKLLEWIGGGIVAGLTTAGTRRSATKTINSINIDPFNPEQAEAIDKLWHSQSKRLRGTEFMTPFFAGGGGFIFEIGEKNRVPFPTYPEVIGGAITAGVLLTGSGDVSDYRQLTKIRKLSGESRPSSSASELRA